MSEITTHVLDTSTGRPAAGMPVILEIESSHNEWNELGRGKTDFDGRLRELLAPGSLKEGTYRLTFDSGAYFASRKVAAIYPRVCVIFTVLRANEHHHIPLLLGPFGYTTYRGS
jgi:5-hydroxyisourate hydrolase